MKLSDAGMALLGELEGFRGTKYLDQGGRPTIGFGHLIKPSEQFDKITKEEAMDLLRVDVEEAEDAINDLVTISLSQNEFDALVIFVYNIGRSALRSSTTLKVINSGNKRQVPKWLRKWVYVTIDGGAKLRSDGLENRREKEIELWQRK